MKKIIFSALCIVAMLILPACSRKDGYDFEKLPLSDFEMQTQAEVTAHITAKSIDESTQRIGIMLTNHGNKIYNFGMEFIMEVQDNKGWHRLPVKNSSLPAIAQVLGSEEITTFTADVTGQYGELLPDYSYRIIKKLDSDTAVAVNFTVAK